MVRVIGLKSVMLGTMLIAAVACLFGCHETEEDPVDNSVPDIEIVRVKAVKDFVSIEDKGLVLFETADGNPVYDLDINKKSLETGQTASFSEYADAGLTYILHNGYPYKSLVNNDGIDGFITQLAVWWYMDEESVSNHIKEADDDTTAGTIVNVTRDLVEHARKAKFDNGAESEAARIYATQDEEAARVVGLFDEDGSNGDIASNAQAQEEVTVESVDKSQDWLHAGEAGMEIYETADGVALYDMDLGLSAIKDGQTLSYVEDADAGVQYILENGYPNKTYKNNVGMDAYITQIALWWYLSEDTLSSDVKNATAEEDEYNLLDSIKKLVEGARAASETDSSKVARVYASSDSGATRMVGLF